MRMKIIILPSLLGLLLMPAMGAALEPIEQLGKEIFFDKNLSLKGNQSCASCHAPESGWTGPDANINAQGAVYEGSEAGKFGNRKPPSAAYGGDSPTLSQDAKSHAWVGGMFWDGRATGWDLGDPLAEQAKGPFLNPREQAIPTAETLVAKIQASTYAKLFAAQCTSIDITELYDCVGRAIAAYERSSEVSSFTSKYDYWLKGKVKLTAEEHLGRALFQGKAKCAACHTIKGKQPVFTDFTYDNLGFPKNPDNPVYVEKPNFIDNGLGGYLGDSAENGKHKVPTLRNVDLRPDKGFVKAYGHNGYFKSLEEIVHFYNTRDVPSAGWPEPEVRDSVNTSELGDLGLTAKEEAAIVAFMKTLSDGYIPQ